MTDKTLKTQGGNSAGGVLDIVVTGLLIAMVFVATRFINIRLPIAINGGLVHLGNVALFISAIVFGKKKGACAGAFGMGLFDVLSGWLAWAPFTFVIRGIMGYIIGSIANINGKNGRNLGYNIVALTAGSVWMLAGYYIAEVILYGNWVTPLTSIPGNLLQLAFGAVSLLIVPAIERYKSIGLSFARR